MSALTKKIDFIGFITVERSNPNGDPLNGNQPRTDYGGYGEISDVCLKRKLHSLQVFFTHGRNLIFQYKVSESSS